MKRTRNLILSFLLLSSLPSFADVADPPVVSTDESAPVYYLIQNWDTKEFYLDNGTTDQLWSVNGLSNVATGGTKHDVDDYLFYFIAAGESYKIGSKKAGSGKYLDKTQTYGLSQHLRGSYVAPITHETGFTATGTLWRINKCQYNNVGVEIHDESGKYWMSDYSLGYNYIKLANTSDDNKQVWVLWSFDELVAEAERHNVTGIDYDSLDPQQGSSFKTLVDAITAKQTPDYVTDFINQFEDGTYLIRNRQYGTYLNTNDHAMAPTMLPTQFSVWNISRANGQLTITGYDNQPIRLANSGTSSAQWTLETSASVWQPDFSHSTDNNNRYISFTGMNYTSSLSTHTYYFGMGKTAAERKSDLRPSIDWEIIPVVNNTFERDGKTYELEISIVDDNELVADDILQSPIVRVRNVVRSVEKPAEDVFEGGGWLEDVDHVHFTNRVNEDPETKQKNSDPDKAFKWDKTDAELMFSARLPEFYAARPNRYHASALWQLQCIAQSATSHDAATGHILPEHNIFVLRNLNTGRYIKASDAVLVDGREYPVTTTDEREAAKFFMQKLIDGQYGFYLYHGTTASGTDLDDGGSIYIDGQGDGYSGGLCYDGDLHPTMNSNAAWVVSPAPTLDLQLLVTDVNAETGKNFHNFDWTTFYYPFDVKIVPQENQQVSIYQGGWAGQYDYGSGQKGGNVQMNAIQDVPAGNAVFVSSNKPGGESFVKVILNVYPANSGELTATPENFALNVWKGIVESDDDPKYLWGDDGDGWRDYWVLSKNRLGFLKLLHPSGSYLLPNRAYIDTEMVEAMNGSKVADFNLFIDESIDGIDHLNHSDTDSSVWYTLEGQRLQSKPTKKGLYIHNGKKEIIK